MSERVVYALRVDDTVPLIKFGKSKRLKRRIIELQTSSPFKFELVGTVTGGHALEQLIHGCLGKHRVHGEWYRYEGWAKTVADLIERSNLKLLYKYLDKISALN